MFYELNDVELEQIEEISELTDIDYELRANYIPVENFMSIAKDMLYEYHKLEDEYNDYKNTKAEEPDYYDLWCDRQKGI